MRPRRFELLEILPGSFDGISQRSTHRCLLAQHIDGFEKRSKRVLTDESSDSNLGKFP
jgi:hypothetical protein